MVGVAEIREQLAGMTRDEIRETLASAQENGGGDWTAYRESFIALNPDYQAFFDGVEAQGGALGINSLQEQLLEALNTNPNVLQNMITFADHPEQLAELTGMVTDDSSMLVDEIQSSRLTMALAEENGQGPLGDQTYGGVDISEPPPGTFDTEEFTQEIIELEPIIIDGPELDEHIVEPGESLSQIAIDYYGIDPSNTDAIMDAVEHIAYANPAIEHPSGQTYDLAEGVNAHSIFPGQTVYLPEPERVVSGVEPADIRIDREAILDQIGQGVSIEFNEAVQMEYAQTPELISSNPSDILAMDPEYLETLMDEMGPEALAEFQADLRGSAEFRQALQERIDNGDFSRGSENLMEAQQLMTAAGLYDRGIDGIMGSGTQAGMDRFAELQADSPVMVATAPVARPETLGM